MINYGRAGSVINQMELILTSRAGRELLHRDLDVEIVSLEKSQLWAPCALLQRVSSSVDRFIILPHAEGFVRHHHAHLLHE